MIVADTNLVAYSAIAGDRTAAAEQVRQRDNAWIAPPLWASEFRNFLATYVRIGRLTPTQAHAAWAVGRALVGDLPVEPAAVLDMAFSRGLSGYDAEFVALAERLGVRVVTDDRRVLAVCPDLAVSLDDFVGEDEGNGSESAPSEDAPPDAPDR